MSYLKYISMLQVFYINNNFSSSNTISPFFPNALLWMYVLILFLFDSLQNPLSYMC